MVGVPCRGTPAAPGFHRFERQLAAIPQTSGFCSPNRQVVPLFSGRAEKPLVAWRRHRRCVHARTKILFSWHKAMTPGSSAIVTVAFGHSTEHLDYTFLSFSEKNPGIPLHAFVIG